MSNYISLSYKEILNRLERDGQKTEVIDNDINLIDKAHFFSDDSVVVSTDCIVVVEVLDGQGSIIINDISHKIQPPCILFLLSGFQIQIKFEEIQRARAVVFSSRFINSFFDMSLRINEIMACLLLNPVVKLDDVGYKQTYLYICCLKEIARNKNNDYKVMCAKHLTMAFFYGSLFNYFKSYDDKNSSRMSKIALDFHNLLNKHYMNEHQTTFYAAELCISEKYLYLSVKAITGKTPSFWINCRLINKAKLELSKTDKSIQQISEELNFKSQSHFCRFFKKEIGETALSYRNGKR